MTHTDSLVEVSIEHSGDGRPVVCVVRGEIDISNVQALDDALAQAYQQSSAVVVDLSGVDFLASAGIRAMIDAAVEHAGRVMTVVSGRPVETILRICGMAAVASCHPDRESAVRDCSARSRTARRA